jgi:hypothetical protein
MSGNLLLINTSLQEYDTIEVPYEIRDLCKLLPDVPRSTEGLLPLGYILEREGNCHVLQLIENNGIIPDFRRHELVSLKQLLATESKVRLSRYQRCNIASILASSLLELSTTPWLAGNSIKKEMILFRCTVSVIDSEHPYLDYVFKPHRILSSTQETTLSKRMALRSSITELGILLLELCFGQAIEDQTRLRDKYLTDGKPHADTNYLTARDWVYEVGEEAGEEMEAAIKCCVQCNFDEILDWNNKLFIQTFYNGVIEPLEKVLRRWVS